jgi:hypothetical protein
MIYLVITVATLAIALFLLLFFVSLFEKRSIVSYRDTSSDKKRALPYLDDTVKKMEQANFRITFKQHKKFAITTAFGLSGDKNTLILAGEGKMLGILVKRMSLYTILSDGHILYTTDDYGERDISGLVEMECLLNGDFSELFQKHQDRINRERRLIVSFQQSDLLDAYQEMDRMKTEVLIQRNLARWINLEKTEWKKTIKGAFYSSTGAFEQFQDTKKQKDRIRLKKPGDPRRDTAEPIPPNPIDTLGEKPGKSKKIYVLMAAGVILTMFYPKIQQIAVKKRDQSQLNKLPRYKADFSTPQGAILCIEDAFRKRDIEAAVACKDFRLEAILTAEDNDPNMIDEDAVIELAHALEAAFRNETEQSWSYFDELESYFESEEPLFDNVVCVTEICKYPDGGYSRQKILVGKSNKGWRMLYPLD